MSDTDQQFENGYHFPPKYPWPEATRQFLVSFWKFSMTIKGFLITLYGLNVVAWGGMLFLLLCNASPAMCYRIDPASGERMYDCDDINAPRRIWIEVDSQILNALFCVTGFGLIPWRFRDLYYLLQYRVLGKYEGLQRLAGIHRGWIRLPGSQELPVQVGPGNVPADVPATAIPVPAEKIPKVPRTGVRAPPTQLWKLDFVIWCMVWNTFGQAALSGCMWGLNRYDRPSWVTGFLVGVACIIAIVGGIAQGMEGSHVKAIEGVKVTERDLEKLEQDKELGIPHYNNIKDKNPEEKAKKAKKEKTMEKANTQETNSSPKSSNSNEA